MILIIFGIAKISTKTNKQTKNTNLFSRVDKNEYVSNFKIQSKTILLIHVLSCAVMSDSATPWKVTCHIPLSMGSSQQECWSGLPLPPPYIINS